MSDSRIRELVGNLSGEVIITGMVKFASGGGPLPSGAVGVILQLTGSRNPGVNQGVGVVKAHGVRYPWGEWFGRGCFTLRRGVDFAGSIPGMISTIRVAARRHGLRVSVSAPGDVVMVRVRALGKTGKGGHRATHP